MLETTAYHNNILNRKSNVRWRDQLWQGVEQQWQPYMVWGDHWWRCVWSSGTTCSMDNLQHDTAHAEKLGDQSVKIIRHSQRSAECHHCQSTVSLVTSKVINILKVIRPWVERIWLQQTRDAGIIVKSVTGQCIQAKHFPRMFCLAGLFFRFTGTVDWHVLTPYTST